MERPEKGLEMELRDKKNKKGWRHLLDDEEDSECDSGTEYTGQEADPLFDKLPMDLLPQKYLDNPEDRDCALDDNLAYEQGIENSHMRRKLIKWPKQSEAALRAFLDEQDQRIDAKSRNSGSSHYALQEGWPVKKEEKHHSSGLGYKQKWELDAPSTSAFCDADKDVKPD